jgi:hypothetical protein
MTGEDNIARLDSRRYNNTTHFWSEKESWHLHNILIVDTSSLLWHHTAAVGNSPDYFLKSEKKFCLNIINAVFLILEMYSKYFDPENR